MLTVELRVEFFFPDTSAAILVPRYAKLNIWLELTYRTRFATDQRLS